MRTNQEGAYRRFLVKSGKGMSVWSGSVNGKLGFETVYG